MATNDMPLEQQLKYLEVLANESLCLWDLPDNARARLINVSENATYLVEAGDRKAILRIHQGKLPYASRHRMRAGVGGCAQPRRRGHDAGRLLWP